MALTRGFIRNAATTPLDARLMDMAQIVCNADGSPRAGVLGAVGGPGAALVTTTATMSVNVAAAEFVASKGKADGVSIYTNDGTTAVAISAAPVSNSRIDVIWTRHQDNTTGDGASTPIFGVTAGTAAASPTKPAIPTGALELATLQVFSGSTATNGGGNILTNTYQMTASRGGSVPFRTKADLLLWTTPCAGQIAHDLATGDYFEYFGGAWRGLLSTIVPPSAVTGSGVSIDTDGSIVFNAVPASTVCQLRGIFSTRARHYRIHVKATAKVNAVAYNVAGIVGTSVIATANYSRTRSGMVGGSAIANNQATTQTDFGEALFTDGSGTQVASVLDVFSPNLPEATQIATVANLLGGITGVILMASNLNTTDQLTGLQITTPAGGTTTMRLEVHAVY